jgi:hypothetical protein
MEILEGDRNRPFGLGRNRCDFAVVGWGRSAFDLDPGFVLLCFPVILETLFYYVFGESLGFG